MRFLLYGKKEVKKNVPWASRREQSQKKWIVRKEKNQNLAGGTQEKSKERGTAQKNPSMDFFGDCRITLQFCMLLSRLPGSILYGKKEKPFLFFYTDVKKLGFLGAMLLNVSQHA